MGIKKPNGELNIVYGITHTAKKYKNFVDVPTATGINLNLRIFPLGKLLKSLKWYADYDIKYNDIVGISLYACCIGYDLCK